MAITTRGTELTEYTEKHPEGRSLAKEETGLRDHREASLAAQERARAKGSAAVGFADTPEVDAAFESLKRSRGGDEPAAATEAAAATDPAGDTDHEAETEAPKTGTGRGKKKKGK